MTKKIEETFEVIAPFGSFDALRSIVSDNLVYFKNDRSDTGPKMTENLKKILDIVDTLVPKVEEVELNSQAYNFSDDVKGNGYISWLKISEFLVRRVIKGLEEVSANRNSYFFRRDHYVKEVENYCTALDSMCVVMSYNLSMMSRTKNSYDLIVTNEDYNFKNIILEHGDKYFDQYCFYGKCLCFQFCDSMATVLRALNILMASFSEVYYGDGKIIDPILRGSKYWVDPELRAKRVVNISQYASADFVKNFWFLGEIELMQRIPSIMLPSIQVNKVISLETEPLVITNIYGKEINIPVPSSHLGPSPIPLRLLSPSLRFGMETNSSSRSGYKYPSDCLIFQCHGGGFVSQSSRSHEQYLRQWSIDLDTPILCVDYSLAPEAPYPRALEEIFYSYCWAIKNANLLGSTAEKIILAGDSAGANLNIALTLKCLEYGVKKPHGLFLAYAPVILSLDSSPARMLTFIDPLLPVGITLGLIRAYTSPPEEYPQSLKHERKLRRKVSRSATSKSGSPAQNGQSNGIMRDNSSSDSEEEASKPALMSSGCSSGMVSRWLNSFSSKLGSLSSSRSFSDEDELENEMERERHMILPFDMLIEIERDPFYSPYFASDSVLKNFPPVKILTTEMDPFLDDCIMFGKKLKNLGVSVSLDILPGLPHGFLNFSLLSTEASEGSKLCTQRISELMKGDSMTESSGATSSAEECL